MNIGQVLEVHLGWLAAAGWSIDTNNPDNKDLMEMLPEELYDVPLATATPVFDGASNEEDIAGLLANSRPKPRRRHPGGRQRYGSALSTAAPANRSPTRLPWATPTS